MTTKKIVGLCLLALALSGCTYKATQVFQHNFAKSSLENIQSSIIFAAYNADWNICDNGLGQYRVDKPFKKWKIYADIAYNANGYTITPNTKYTTLVDDGKVHRNVNRVVARFDKQINYQIRSGENHPIPKLPKCSNWESVESESHGSWLIGTSNHSTTAFAWENGEVKVPINTKFTWTITYEADIPQRVLDSMNLRMEQYLDELGYLAVHKETAYKIEIAFHRFGQIDTDHVGANRNLEATTIIKTNQGVPIAKISSAVRADTAGWLGVINLATNKETAALAASIVGAIQEKLMEK